MQKNYITMLLTLKIQSKEKDLTQVILKVYSDKPDGLPGAKEEFASNIRNAVSTIKSAQEIGAYIKDESIAKGATVAGDVVYVEKDGHYEKNEVNIRSK
ncbi:MAG: hypothetical protein ACE5J9_09615, partial [Methanosarcinales archaeon]